MPTPPPSGPVYLARASYRQRRLRDVARMLPLAGAVLWLLPVLYIAPSTGVVGLYVFGVWFVLTLIAAVIAGKLDHTNDAEKGSVDTDDGV